VSGRRLFLLLAPLAAALGLFLNYRYSTGSNLGLSVTKDDVVRIAREQAAAKGVKADAWTDLVDIQPNNELRHYLAISADPAERAALERIVSPIAFRGVLENDVESADSVRVSVSPGGRLISYHVPPIANTPAIPEAQSRQLAENELRSRLGAERNGFVYTGAGGERHDATQSEIKRFTYRRQYGKDLAIESSVETAGAKVIGFKLTPRISPEREKRFFELSAKFNTIRGAGIVLIIIAGLIYIVFRFVRRSREHEVPLKRAAIVAALVFVTFSFSTMINRESQRIGALQTGPAANSAAEIILLLVVSTTMAVLVGVTWGACEADLREAYPEKLTSTDALLGGLLQSRAVRSSLLMGLALAGYATLFSGLEAFLRARLGFWATIQQGELIAYDTAHPGFVVFIFSFTGLPLLMSLVLVAVSATHRTRASVPTRNRQIVMTLLILIFFVFTTAGNYSPPMWAPLQSILAAAVLLVPFFLGDVLTVILATAVSTWTALSASLIAQPAPALRSSGWMMLAVLAVIGSTVTIAAFRRRDAGPEIEAARPQYARNIVERLMLTTEMDAARQAQLRVMPLIVPKIDGVTLAAKHSTSAGIGTDYYEFFPTATHLGVVVADARLPGLSSALCISMLKGLLLNYAARLSDPRDVADRVYRQLSSVFGDDLPVSFFFGRLDRAGSAFAFASFGAAPHAILVRDAEVISLEGEEYAELARNNAVVIYNARLAEMRDRDGAVLGDEAIRAELAAAHSSDPHKLVDAIFDLASRHTRGADADQSWAAVALAPSTSPEVRS
jgi:Stage II sporulation protein E (SpoIIE)